MKAMIATVLISAMPVMMAHSQSVLTLKACYEAARTHYPLSRQQELLEKTKAFTIQNAAKGKLPALQLGAQATYQSEVTQIPIEMPGVEPLSKDQYRVFGEVVQTLYQGGLVGHQADAAALETSVEQAELEVKLYQLEGRINELFFGVLLLREQQKQIALAQADLEAALRKAHAALANGTALPSSAEVLQAELLKVKQRIIEMQASEATFSQMLGAFTGIEIGEDTQLEWPAFTALPATLDRPEQTVFRLQRQRLETGRALLSARQKPRLELFLQGGYGRPGLNMLEDKFGFYYLGGMRLAWRLSGFYTFKNEKEIFSLRSRAVDIAEQTFEFNTALDIGRNHAEIGKLRRLIEVDDEIIVLRTSVRKTAEAQLDEGVISATDYVQEVNAENQARQSRVLHEIQLRNAQADLRFTAGD